MSTLRQRPTGSSQTKAGLQSTGGEDEPGGFRYGHLNSQRTYIVLLSSLALAVLLYLYKPMPSALLPRSYAVCTPDALNVYTVNKNNSQVECILVHDSQILGVGLLRDIQLRWQAVGSHSPFTVYYTPKDSIVVPGLSDSHAHILEYGASRQLALEGGKTIEATVALVKEHVLANPDLYADQSHYIRGWGWDHTSWPVEKWPTAADLEEDLSIRGRPVILQSKDGHALWVSKSVLEMASPFPEHISGGVIVRGMSGEPTGVFIDNAQDLVKGPPLTDKDLAVHLSIAGNDALSLGLTSVHDAGFDPASLAFFKRQADQGKLPIRIYGMTFFDENGEYWGNSTEPLVDAGDGRLNARSVKIFADGALRTAGAALFEAYSDNEDTSGFMRLSQNVLDNDIPRFIQDGWQVNVHAIGDRANSLVLDAFEAALKGANVSALRPRLEHAQIMTSADMARVGKLGVIASVQPTHAVSDMWYAQDRLGPERVKGLYAFRSLMDYGARIALGSDFPVEDMNPLAGFHAAITRLAPDGSSPHGPGGWHPDQRLTRTEALRGMTIDPAYASFTEDSLGSLEPGKRADFVVLSQNIMNVPQEQVLETKVLATVLDGAPVFGSL